MNKLSQLISLPIINIYDAKIEGFVENIYINKDTKKIEQLIVYDEDYDAYKTILFAQIYKIGNDAIFIRNSSMITLSENLEPLPRNLVSPINAHCYNFDGKYLGKLEDLHFEGNTINYLLINGKQYAVKTAITINNKLLLLSSEKQVSIKNFRPHRRKKTLISSSLNTNEPVVNILNSFAPIKQITNYNFLLNRVITQDIKNSSGEIIANKDTIITIKTINKLRRYGKLKELVLYSK